ncbi:MAG TPA: type II secretion system F family protein [Gemmataceae bacterium]|jgi:tight adherence protein C|nr:type II secretion system F family protein [Gemmataceae bacterium]
MHSGELASMLIFLAIFFAIVAAPLALLFWFRADRQRAVERLRELSEKDEEVPTASLGELGWTALRRVGSWLTPGQQKQRTLLAARFTSAGIYNPRAVSTFLGFQMVLAVAFPVLAALIPFLCGLLSLRTALFISAFAAGFGGLLPGYWLDAKKKARQAALRLGLPDAVDMLVLCLEGGISLPAAMQRVTAELGSIHPLLAGELNIAQREIDMGLSIGEALKKVGERCDLEEMRDLAGVILQSERFGAGAVKSLRIHADSWRLERQQKLEETAQKAAVKILFPTLLCIFPAVFIVTLGPAVYQIARMFMK